MRLTLDQAVFSNFAGDATRPPGLLADVAPLTPTAGGGTDAVIGDLKKLTAALAAGGVSTDNAVIVAAPEQAVVLATALPQAIKNQIYGTAGIPSGTVILISPDAVATASDGRARFDRSRDAVAHMEDMTPLLIGGVGSPPVVAAPAVSAFQSDSEFLKLSVQCAWSVAPNAIAWTETSHG